MKTIEQIGWFISIYERYHPERTPEEIKELTLSLISDLPDSEKERFIEEYRIWYGEKFDEELEEEEDYFSLYKETNEAS